MESHDSTPLTREAYLKLLQKIVDHHFPDENLAFELDGQEMVQSLFADDWRGHEDGQGEQYGFADLTSVKPVLDIALVALSTFKIICELRKTLQQQKSKTINAEELEQQWAKRLQLEGVKSAKAKAVANEFTQQLLALTK
jgi:hypothetical protein